MSAVPWSVTGTANWRKRVGVTGAGSDESTHPALTSIVTPAATNRPSAGARAP